MWIYIPESSGLCGREDGKYSFNLGWSTHGDKNALMRARWFNFPCPDGLGPGINHQIAPMFDTDRTWNPLESHAQTLLREEYWNDDIWCHLSFLDISESGWEEGSGAGGGDSPEGMDMSGDAEASGEG